MQPIIRRHKGTWLKFAKFCLIGGFGFLIAYSLLWVLTEYVGFWYMISALIAQAVATIWNFTFGLKWVFKDKFNGHKD